MLSIRLQRLGRKKQPVYRLVVQESQLHPSSGRIVTYVGTYNPHSKDVSLDNEKVNFYLKNGAQPSPRVINLLESNKIALPDWIKQTSKRNRLIKNPDKLRKNQPKEEAPSEVSAES